jgi:hypothetical protein
MDLIARWACNRAPSTHLQVSLNDLDDSLRTLRPVCEHSRSQAVAVLCATGFGRCLGIPAWAPIGIHLYPLREAGFRLNQRNRGMSHEQGCNHCFSGRRAGSPMTRQKSRSGISRPGGRGLLPTARRKRRSPDRQLRHRPGNRRRGCRPGSRHPLSARDRSAHSRGSRAPSGRRQPVDFTAAICRGLSTSPALFRRPYQAILAGAKA